MAEELRRQRIKTINDDGIERVSYPPIAKQWVNRFLARHPELNSTIGRTIDAVWIKDVTKDRFMKWFNDVHKIFNEHNIDLKNVYNMDESGFSIRKLNATHIIINKNLALNIKLNQVSRNGFRLSNVFVLMERQSLVSSFFAEKTSRLPEYQLI